MQSSINIPINYGILKYIVITDSRLQDLNVFRLYYNESLLNCRYKSSLHIFPKEKSLQASSTIISDYSCEYTIPN